MSKKKLPQWYEKLVKEHSEFISAIEELGKAVEGQGPLDEKTAHLIQMAAATAIRSHGAVRSHARRALEAGASTQELYHAVLCLISTLGFPVVAAAVGWVDDVVETAD